MPMPDPGLPLNLKFIPVHSCFVFFKQPITRFRNTIMHQFKYFSHKERQGAEAQRFSWRLNYFAPLREIRRKIISDFKLMHYPKYTYDFVQEII